jgi:hypothetical protein
MTSPAGNETGSGNKVTINLSGTVQKIIRGIDAEDPEKIQIVVRGAEDLYREIRLDNLFHNEEGNFVNLKLGDEVEITIASKKRRHPKLNKRIRDSLLFTRPAVYGESYVR